MLQGKDAEGTNMHIYCNEQYLQENLHTVQVFRYKREIKQEYDIDFDPEETREQEGNYFEIKDEDILNLNHSVKLESDSEPAEEETYVIDKTASKKVWTCKKCTETFPKLKILKAHLKTHIQNELQEDHTYKFDVIQDLYICNTCCAEFQEETEAQQHIKDMHVNQYSCAQCAKNFKTLHKLGSHSAEHHPEGHVTCSLCKYQNPKKSCLYVHINNVHLKKFAYFCKTCGKGFNNQILCKEHANEHLGVKPFSCVVCMKNFVFSSNLYMHQVRTHIVNIDGKLLPNQCPYCSRKYTKPKTLEKHLKETHFKVGPQEKKHLCVICGRGFAQRSKLVIHERIHTGHKPYACRFCQKCFAKRDYLIHHERVHTGEKPYPCEYCGKCFNQGTLLKIHLRIHTKEKPYTCSHCDAKFTYKTSLYKHKNCPSKV